MGHNADIETSLFNANTTFVERGSELSRMAIMPGPYALWTEVLQNEGNWERHFLRNHPMMRQWTGARQLKQLRAYKENLLPVPYEATMPIPRLTLVRDKTGSVEQAIDVFVSQAAMAYDEAVAGSIDGSSGNGPTGADGVSLFNNSHPNVNSGSGHDNLAASTNFSHANFNTARAAMRKFVFENGQPMHVRPTHIRVSPDLEQRAKEVLEAKDRLVAIDEGADEATSAVIAATSKVNVWAGECTVVVDERITSNTYYWTLFDLSKGGMKPMVLIEERRPQPIHLTEMTDEKRFWEDDFYYGMEGEWKVGAGEWQLAYRGTGTA